MHAYNEEQVRMNEREREREREGTERSWSYEDDAD
jgi:hypothetical protein